MGKMVIKRGYVLTDILISLSIIAMFLGVVSSVILLNYKVNKKINLEKEGTYALECIAKEIKGNKGLDELIKNRENNNMFFDIEPILKDKIWREEVFKYELSKGVKLNNYAKVSLTNEDKLKIFVNIRRGDLLYEDYIELKRDDEN